MVKTRKARLNVSVYFNKNDKTVYKSHLHTKSKVIPAVTVFTRQNANKWETGMCKVTYDVKNDYWNKFYFDSLEDFIKKYHQCVENDLLQYFEVIDKEDSTKGMVGGLHD